MNQPHAWMEISTRDNDGTKAFYTALFGWQASDADMGEMGNYSMFLHDEQHFGGIAQMNGPHWEGCQPTWTLYFNVDDVDAGCARVEELGGQVKCPPFDIPTVGRAALVADPQGASFYLFKGMPKPE